MYTVYANAQIRSHFALISSKQREAEIDQVLRLRRLIGFDPHPHLQSSLSSVSSKQIDFDPHSPSSSTSTQRFDPRLVFDFDPRLLRLRLFDPRLRPSSRLRLRPHCFALISSSIREFTWDDVKVDKHRENYLGHSIKAPVGRWQKGKDLNWYARDKKSQGLDMEAAKEEIRRIKEEEEQAMREALGLAPKRASRPQGTRLDKHEFSELVKRGSTAEDLGAGHAEAAQVQGLGFSRAPRAWEESSSLQPNLKDELPEKMEPSISSPTVRKSEESDDERSQKKRRREEKKHEKHEKRSEKRHSRDSDDKRRSKKGKERRRHDSD